MDEKKTVSEFIDMINSAEKMYLEKMDFIKENYKNQNDSGYQKELDRIEGSIDALKWLKDDLAYDKRIY